MNEKVAAILAGGEAADKTTDWTPLAEDAAPAFLMVEVDRVRKWMGLRPSPGSIRPSEEFLEAFLGHGRVACVAIVEAYVEDQRLGLAEIEALLRAASLLVRRAGALRLTTGWDIDTLTVEQARRPRLIVELSTSVDARLRAEAARSGQTLREFVEGAVAERLSQAERARPKLKESAAPAATT